MKTKRPAKRGAKAPGLSKKNRLTRTAHVMVVVPGDTQKLFTNFTDALNFVSELGAGAQYVAVAGRGLKRVHLLP